MSYERVKFRIDGGIGHFVLAAPERSNAIDNVTAREILEVARTCATAADLRCLFISAEGARFTVGGDIRSFGDEGTNLPQRLRDDISLYHEALEIFFTLPAPIVTEVRGAAAGGGLGLVYIADLVYATPDTRFVTGFLELGLTGDGAGTWFLPHIVGLRRAIEIYLTNRVLGAEEAKALGIVTGVVEEAAIRDHCLEVARAMSKRLGTSVRSLRRLMFGATDTPFAEHLQREIEAICEAAADPEAQALIRTVAEKMRR